MATRAKGTSNETPSASGAGGEDWGVSVGPHGGVLDSRAGSDAGDEDSVIDKLRGYFQTNGTSDVRVCLYQLDPRTRRFGYCAEYAPADFIAGGLDRIRDEWGAGEYEARVYGNGRGQATGGRFTIIPKPGANMARAEPVYAQREDSSIAAALASLAESNRALMARLEHAPRENPLAMMRELAAVMRELAPAPAPAAVAANAVDPVSMVRSVFEMLREAKSAVDELDDRAPKNDDSPMAMLPTLLQIINKSAGDSAPATIAPVRVPAAPVAIPTAPAAPAAPAVPAVPAAPEATSTPQVNEAMQMMSASVEHLMSMHASGKTPQDCGQWIADEMPEKLLPLLDRPDWFELVKQFAPQTVAIETWLRESKAIADKILDEYEASDSAEDQAGAP